jgi:hypothetical protein
MDPMSRAQHLAPFARAVNAKEGACQGRQLLWLDGFRATPLYCRHRKINAAGGFHDDYWACRLVR